MLEEFAMPNLASLNGSQTAVSTVDEIIQVFDRLVDCGNINGCTHTYFSGCVIPFEMLRKLKDGLVSLSDSIFFCSFNGIPSIVIQIADLTEDSCRITHICKDGKWYIFRDGYRDIHLSFRSED